MEGGGLNRAAIQIEPWMTEGKIATEALEVRTELGRLGEDLNMPELTAGLAAAVPETEISRLRRFEMKYGVK